MTLTYDDLLDAVFGEAPAIVAPDIVEWAETNFYVVETSKPITLAPHQRDILRLFTERKPDGSFRWRNCLYSTIKKSGKTTISALYARWACETWGMYQEVYNLGNKFKQAKDRAFKIARRSIELAPADVRAKWDIQSTRMTYLPTGSFIEALPVSAAGEAGGNQSLTVWTELWGFQYEEALRMWDELKPVPTRPLSQRFIDTYAGFEGVSELLKTLWDLGLAGERLHPDLPVYGNEDAGLIAYIDQGAEARRMPWQRGDEGERYYREQARTERPENYLRHHENRWASSVDSLISIPLWDRLEDEPPSNVRLPVTIGADASVSGDCTALVAVAYDQAADKVYELETYIWTPPINGRLDYSQTIEPALEDMLRRYPVRTVTYDPYQLHDFMTRMGKRHTRVEWVQFNQGADRLRADTALVNRIRQGTIAHSGNDELRDHLQNADGQQSGDDALRIVKRHPLKPIDGAVALSMAAYRASVTVKRTGLRLVGNKGLYASREG